MFRVKGRACGFEPHAILAGTAVQGGVLSPKHPIPASKLAKQLPLKQSFPPTRTLPYTVILEEVSGPLPTFTHRPGPAGLKITWRSGSGTPTGARPR